MRNLYMVEIKAEISTTHDRQFFTNKRKAIAYGKKITADNELVEDTGSTVWEESINYTYTLKTLKMPKNQSEWIALINFYGRPDPVE